MQDVLISLQTDLASSIAIRYACQLEKLVRFTMQVLHIPDMDETGHSHGSGWVHETWENAIVQQAREDIAKLVQKELFHYSTVEPKIIPGERDLVILEEIRQKKYDFFIEGLLHSFEPDRFFQKLDSELYRSLSCPALLVKNLVNLDRGIQIVGTKETVPTLLYWFFKVFNKPTADPDILLCHFETSWEEAVFMENDTVLISDIESDFLKQGKTVGKIKTVKGSPDGLALLVRDHALVISAYPQSQSDMAHLLSMSPCSILFCPEFKID